MLPAVRRFQVGVGATLDAREVLERNRSSVGGFVQDGGELRQPKLPREKRVDDSVLEILCNGIVPSFLQP